MLATDKSSFSGEPLLAAGQTAAAAGGAVNDERFELYVQPLRRLRSCLHAARAAR